MALKKNIFLKTIVWMVPLLTFIGCLTPIQKFREKKAETPDKSSYYVHTVRWEGESLSIIAKWYSGEIRHWKTLAGVNPEFHPDSIHIGDRISIPEELLKTRDAMPKDFVMQFQTKPTKKANPEPQEEENFVLFGPKEYEKK